MLAASKGNLRLRCVSNARRAFSSAGNDSLVLTSMDESSGVATMTMNRPPANALSVDMFHALSDSIKSVEANPKIQSLIVASSQPSIFCAGLDLTDIYLGDSKEPSYLHDFWGLFQQLYLDLYGSRLATVSAIAGHAHAGGCFMATSCDYRIMTTDIGGSGKIPLIGLNETKFGLTAPLWMAQQYVDTIGMRRAELALSQGTLFTPEEALIIGLVDELVDAKTDDIMEVAQARAVEWASIPTVARSITKQTVRAQALSFLQNSESRQKDVDSSAGFLANPKTQAALGAYLKTLSSKKPKK